MGAGQVIENRICWSDISAQLPEQVSQFTKSGYGSDYGDADADGDIDLFITGIGGGRTTCS